MMEAIIDNLRTVWDLPFAREVLLMGATAILTHFFGMRKFKKERHTKYQDQIGEKIASALIAVREIVLSTKSVEIYQYDIDHSPADSTKAIHNMIYYPTFMTSRQTLMQLGEAVSDARDKHEPYLDLMSAAYLYVFEKYLLNLAMFVKKQDFQGGLEALGLMVIVDVQRWERKFDRHLVRRINRPHYRLFSRDGWMWARAKKYVEERYLFNTELNKIMKIGAEISEEENAEKLSQHVEKNESEEDHA